MSKKPILLNAFTMNCVGHIHHGLWTHPRDTSHQYTTLSYWTNLAKTLEKGLFDGLFIADIIGYYDVYHGNVDVTLKESVQLPANDPWPLISAMAAVTTHLGFGVTANVSAEVPYTFARRVSTLDHLTNGRLAWNVVTGYIDSGARALGQDAMEQHDQRYARAEDFLNVCYKLWEGSWQEDALQNNKSQRIYADPQKVHSIEHQGPFYSVSGYHMSAPSPQRTPVIYQAGASTRGVSFAGGHAEGVFIAAGKIEVAKESVRKLRQAAAAQGRNPKDLKVFVGIAVIVAPTEEQAKAKFAEYQHYANADAGLAHHAASTGVDFANYDDQQLLDFSGSNAIQSANQRFAGRGQTKADLLAQFQLGGSYANIVVGNPQQVADELERWIDEADVDGFNLTRIVMPETYEDFVELVVPELQRRGRYKTGYSQGTLREKLFARKAQLEATHPAAVYRAKKEQAA